MSPGKALRTAERVLRDKEADCRHRAEQAGPSQAAAAAAWRRDGETFSQAAAELRRMGGYLHSID